MNPIPIAWAVLFDHHGEKAIFITLERSKADDYAAHVHGTIEPLYFKSQFVGEN